MIGSKCYIRYGTKEGKYVNQIKKLLLKQLGVLQTFSKDKLKLKHQCLIILIGKTTYLNSSIDKDIKSALTKRMGIIGIKIYDNRTKNIHIPVRLEDNLESGYVKIYDKKDIVNLKEIVEDSIERSWEKIPNLSRATFGVKRDIKNFSGKKNIFISHKKEDKKKVEAITVYLKQLGINVYVDIYDKKLQNESKINNNRKVVRMIEQQLETCSNFFCIISNKTKESWWVPYEIGIAKANKKKITSIITKQKTDKIPEFLSIEERVYTFDDLKSVIRNNWLYKLDSYTFDVLTNKNKKLLSNVLN